MAENLIQQVKSLEAEADAIVAEARAAAGRIEQAAAGEATALREQFEEGFRREVAGLGAEQKQRIGRERADLDGRARKIAEALKSVAPEASEKAVGLVLRHLRGG